jgi:hypothetical protein
VPKIQNFLLTNVKFQQSLESVDPEDGSEAIAEAISFAVNTALSSPIVQTAFAVGIAPPGAPTAGGPVGQLIYQALKTSIQEQ